MKTAIIGAGGVGGYFGGKMAHAGLDVTFISRGENLKALREKGLTVKSISGNFSMANVKATESFAEIGQPDLIILCVKAWQVKEIMPALLKNVHRDTVILPLQNGIMACDEIKETADEKHAVGGLCRIISKIESPGVIEHFGVDPLIIFGELDHAMTNRVKAIKSVFDEAGISSRISADIHAELWKKFIPICTSALLAVTRSTYGEVREMKETRKLMVDIIQENFNLSQKLGIAIEADFVEKAVAYIDSFPYHSTSSLTRDIWENKPSEIEYQNGTSVRLGEKLGIEVPVNRFVYHCILPMEKKAREEKKERDS
ncbi:MAG: ketopantoate reductase family protein [Bacteroidales bacterium]|nr:ketopantoate reductase family protein [Bacteroidales bacterium]